MGSIPGGQKGPCGGPDRRAGTSEQLGPADPGRGAGRRAPGSARWSVSGEKGRDGQVGAEIRLDRGLSFDTGCRAASFSGRGVLSTGVGGEQLPWPPRTRCQERTMGVPGWPRVPWGRTARRQVPARGSGFSGRSGQCRQQCEGPSLPPASSWSLSCWRLRSQPLSSPWGRRAVQCWLSRGGDSS